MLIFIVNITIRDIKNKASFNKIRSVILRYAQEAVAAARQYTGPSHEEDDDDDHHHHQDHIDEEEESSEDEVIHEENEEEDDEDTHRRIIQEYKFGLREFNMLLDTLPMQLDDYVLKLDLFDGYLSVRTIPGDPHGKATGIFCQQILLWAQDATNMTINGQPLDCALDASMFFSSVR